MKTGLERSWRMIRVRRSVNAFVRTKLYCQFVRNPEPFVSLASLIVMNPTCPLPLLPDTLPPNFAKGIDGLLPAIAQDAQSRQVLMVAWMNAEAFAESMATGYATYFSRSRGKLWRKGEESGHRQRVIAVRVDCDADSILLLVEQTGAACHQGFASCFFREYRQGRLEVVESRLVDPDQVYAEGSRH